MTEESFDVLVPVFVASLLLMTLGTGMALTGQYRASSGVTYQTTSDLAVETQKAIQVQSGNPTVNDNSILLKGVLFNASGDSSVDVDDFQTGRFVNTTNINAGPGVTIRRQSFQNETTLRDSITDADITDVTPVRSGDADLVYSASSDSQVTFETNGNGIVAVDLSTGNALDEASPNGDTATVTLPSGTNTIGLREGPQNLTISTVSAPRQTLTGQTQVNVTFYERDSERVFDRSDTDGTISFEGLPQTESFIARANAQNYTDRRVLIDSIFEQSTVYLLENDNSTDIINATFSITDNTGTFGDDSTLQVQRALNTTDTGVGERKYLNVAGAVIGENREFTTTLEADVRYRLVISNGQGEQRQLGSIVPQRDRAYALEVTGLDFRPGTNGTSETVATNMTISGSGGSKTKTLEFVYDDAQNETTALDGVIYERNNRSNTLTRFQPSSSSFPLGRFVFKTTVSGADANTTWVVEYNYTRNGADQSGVSAFAGTRYDVDFPLGSGWQQIFGVGLLLVLGGVFSLSNARIGALIIPGVALMLWQIGFLTGATSLLGIGIAFSLAVAYNIIQTSSTVVGP